MKFELSGDIINVYTESNHLTPHHDAGTITMCEGKPIFTPSCEFVYLSTKDMLEIINYMDGLNKEPKPISNEGKIGAALDVAVMLIKEHMECKNNECKCREGYGICPQCKDAATKFLNSLKLLKIDIHQIKTTDNHGNLKINITGETNDDTVKRTTN